MNVQPLMDFQLHPWLASLPKADLHLHQEEKPRLERILARRQGRSPYDWRSWVEHFMENTPPGLNRLQDMCTPETTFPLDGVVGDSAELIIAKILDLLEEEAADGAILVEVRCGVTSLAMLRSDFMMLFREAESQAQRRYPQLRAEALAFLRVVNDAEYLRMAELQLEGCLQLAKQGLAGIDFLVSPYEIEADPALWAIVAEWAARAASAGLGITLHAGEFSTANLAAALRIPHLQRIGHGVYAAKEPRLLEQLAARGITVECSLSCNVILGAVPSYQAHPIKEFLAAGVPVTLNTDDPVRVWTTIGREYAIAEALGFTLMDLTGFTRNGIRASFTTPARKDELLERVRQWQVAYEASVKVPLHGQFARTIGER